MKLALSFKQPNLAQEKAGVITFVTLQFVSQAAHVGFGFIFVMIPSLFWGLHGMWAASGIVTIGSAIKEYWDVHGLEDDQTSGGVKGSWEDWAFWMVGNALAVSALIFGRRCIY